MEHLISLIIPVYNVEQYLDRCLESVIAQTYRNLEILLIDDGSTDGSSEMCDRWAEKDHRIQVVHKENAGVSKARNTGLEIAAGNYIMFLDADDYLEHNAVQVLYARIIKDDSDLAIGRHVDIYPDGSIDDCIYRKIQNCCMSACDVFHSAAEKQDKQICVVSWAKLYKADLWKEIRFPTLICGEDLWVFPSIINQCRKISYVENIVYFYYQRENSALHKKSQRAALDEISAVLNFSQFLWKNGYMNGSVVWYEKAVRKAYSLGPGSCDVLFERNFTERERIKLLLRSSPRTKAKWFLLRNPIVYKAMQKIVTRKNKKEK